MSAVARESWQIVADDGCVGVVTWDREACGVAVAWRWRACEQAAAGEQGSEAEQRAKAGEE